MTTNEQLLRQAIADKAPVRATYQGRVRKMCPHILGYKGTELHLLAYQYGGQSSSRQIVTPSDPNNGPSEYWWCIVVAELVGLTVLPVGLWYTCQRHTQAQRRVDTVLAEVPRTWPL